MWAVTRGARWQPWRLRIVVVVADGGGGEKRDGTVMMHLYMLPTYIIYWYLPNNKIYPQQQLPTTQNLVTCLYGC
jgi:hypothetical protein